MVAMIYQCSTYHFQGLLVYLYMQFVSAQGHQQTCCRVQGLLKQLYKAMSLP